MDEKQLTNAMFDIMAYDTGCTDSGIHDERLREEIKTRLKAMSVDDLGLYIGRALREQYLSEEALAKGYGVEDVREFLEWLHERMGISGGF